MPVAGHDYSPGREDGGRGECPLDVQDREGGEGPCPGLVAFRAVGLPDAEVLCASATDQEIPVREADRETIVMRVDRLEEMPGAVGEVFGRRGPDETFRVAAHDDHLAAGQQ